MIEDRGMHEIIRDSWPIITAIVACVVWLVRMEAKAGGNTQAILRLEKQIDQDRQSANASRAETNAMLSEVRTDIKRLLERNAQL